MIRHTQQLKNLIVRKRMNRIFRRCEQSQFFRDVDHYIVMLQQEGKEGFAALQTSIDGMGSQCLVNHRTNKISL